MIYDYIMKDYKGQEVPLSNFRGKVLLIVNTATKCGFTPQYDELMELYKKYNDKGFEILDFPFEYSHETPFPASGRADLRLVEASFREVFRKSAAFLA